MEREEREGFAREKVALAPPARPQRVGFLMGAPAETFLKSGENGGVGCMAGARFYHRRKKSGPGGLLGGLVEML